MGEVGLIILISLGNLLIGDWQYGFFCNFGFVCHIHSAFFNQFGCKQLITIQKQVAFFELFSKLFIWLTRQLLMVKASD